LGVAKKLLEINRVKVRTGASAPIEIVSAEAGVSSRETEVLVGANTIRSRADGIRRLVLPLNELADWDIAVTPTDDPHGPVLVLPKVGVCIADAMDQRPDLLEAQLMVLDRAVDIAVADTDILPKLDISGSLTWLGIDGELDDSLRSMLGDEGAVSWTLGVSFELPIGNRAARARLSIARLSRDQAIRQLKDLELTAIAEIRAAYRSVDVAERTVRSQGKTVDLKTQELKNEQIKLAQRVSTNFQVLEVEADLAESRSLVLRAAVDYRIALADLARAMGTTLDVLAWPVRMP
jgi:outer membrane protein TolC